jgi:hypothetical protein
MSVSYAQLANSEEYKGQALLEEVSLFDTVHVYFPLLNVQASARVKKVKYNCILDRVESVTLGSVRANIADTISNQMAAIENTPTKSDVKRAQEAATAWLTNGKGYKVERRDDLGRVIDTLYLDTPDINSAVNVLRIGQSGIGFSQSGVGGPYVSAWTIDGHFNADFIRTGTLVSADGTVKVNLATGEVTIDGEREGYDADGEAKMYKTKLVLSHSGINGYGENDEGMMEHTLDLGIGVAGSSTTLFNPAWNLNTGMVIAPAHGEFTLGTSTCGTHIRGSYIEFHRGGSVVASIDSTGLSGRWGAVGESDDGGYYADFGSFKVCWGQMIVKYSATTSGNGNYYGDAHRATGDIIGGTFGVQFNGEPTINLQVRQGTTSVLELETVTVDSTCIHQIRVHRSNSYTDNEGVLVDYFAIGM